MKAHVLNEQCQTQERIRRKQPSELLSSDEQFNGTRLNFVSLLLNTKIFCKIY